MIKRWFFILLLFPLCLAAQTELTLDSSKVEIRTFDAEQLEKLKDDRAFDYGDVVRPVSASSSLIRYYLAKLLDKLFSNEHYLDISALLIIGLVVFLLFRKQLNFILFGKEKSTKINFEEISDDIHATDLDKLLQKAINQKAYRPAVRILYLKLLRQLSDKKVIDWKLEKTNHQYWREISNQQILQEFKQLTQTYEVVWYGNFSIDQHKFETIYNRFQQAFK